MEIKNKRILTIEETEQLLEKKEEKAFVEGIKPVEKKKEDKYYLPVLFINDATQWEKKPLLERTYFSNEVAQNVCLGNCCGVKGLKGACCLLDPEDPEHVLGPVDESWIKETLKYFKQKKIPFKRKDVVIDFEEGKIIGDKFFNGHNVFKSPESYPILRIQVFGPRFACKFLNLETMMCNIYSVRPSMCRTYYCQYIKANYVSEKINIKLIQPKSSTKTNNTEEEK